jgi:Winged helix DNA-binding domain
MKPVDIAHRRLDSQRITETPFENPADVMHWLGAVQAQDYLGSLWALGLRLRRAVEAEIEQAIADKAIIRTWPLRGTLHYVAAVDVRWMLGLSGSRTIARDARRYRQLELDEATFVKSRRVLARALRGGKQLTRPELAAALNRAGISTDGQRLIHIMNHAALSGLVCYAARRGKQFTFALLDEWVPVGKTLERDEALAELARRYFTSHGPATLQDFVWWSGLQTADARAGLAMAQPRLVQEIIGGQAYWLSSSTPAAKSATPTAYLLPPFDEYTVAYKDRSAVLDPSSAKQVNVGNGIFSPVIVINGQVVGTWKRTLKKGAVVITPSPFTSLKRAETRALIAAAHRYGAFLELPAVLA